MLDHFISFQDLVQHVQRTAPIHHEVFRDNLEPIYNWFFFKDMLVVRDSKANADTIVRIPIETIRGHRRYVTGYVEKIWRTRSLFPPALLRREKPEFTCDLPSASRLSGIHPCLCSRSCLCSYHSRPCLYRSSGLYRRAFLSCLWRLSCLNRSFRPCHHRCFAPSRSPLCQPQIQTEQHPLAVLA